MSPRVDALLCDHVQPGGDGKLYVAGGGASAFAVVAEQAPFWVRFGVAGTVTLTDVAEGGYDVAVWAEDLDGVRLGIRPPLHRGDPLSAVRGRLDPTGRVDPDRQGDHVLALCISFEAEVGGPGEGVVVVAVEHAEPRRLPFTVAVVVPSGSEVP